MGAFDDDFAFVAASARRAAGLQRDACRAALDSDGLRGTALARHLDLTYAAIEQRISDRQARYSSAPDDEVREDAIIEMRRLLWEVRKLQSNLAWLDSLYRPPLDLGTTYFVEQAARILIAADIEVTVVSTEHTSYATSSDPWGPLIEAWGDGIPAGEPTVVVILIPRREEHSGLLHPLIMHELGHAADSRHGLVDAIWDTAQKRVRFSGQFSKAVSDFSAEHKVDPRDANDLISQRLRSWIAESLCDCIAVHYLGPTYLYSFLAEVAAGNMNDPSIKHPAPRQRIRLLVDHLDRLRWKDVMEAGDAKLATWIRSLIAERPEYTGADQFLTWAVDDLSSALRKATKRLLGSHLFAPDESELSEVMTLLSTRIPPVQRRTGEAVARESIMLACWHASLAGSGYGPAALATAPDTPELADILPAALELSALTEAWQTA